MDFYLDLLKIYIQTIPMLCVCVSFRMVYIIQSSHTLSLMLQCLWCLLFMMLVIAIRITFVKLKNACVGVAVIYLAQSNTLRSLRFHRR